jgi:hypothetical protein
MLGAYLRAIPAVKMHGTTAREHGPAQIAQNTLGNGKMTNDMGKEL